LVTEWKVPVFSQRHEREREGPFFFKKKKKERKEKKRIGFVFYMKAEKPNLVGDTSGLLVCVWGAKYTIKLPL
jgi:hypothetical protein